MVFDLHFFLWAIPAVILAGMSKGGFGGALGFAAAPILAVAVPPAFAVGLMLPLLLIMDVTSVRSYWKQWDWPSVKILLWGSVPGTLVGMAIYSYADDDMLRVLIGIVALGFVLYRILQGLGRIGAVRADRPWVGVVFGALGGLTSFISHAGGPPVAVYLLSKDMTKTSYHATQAIVFWVLNAAKVVPYVFLGLFTLETMKADVLLFPFAMLGVWIGVRAHHKIPDRVFFALTYVLLVITGVKLIFDGLT